MSSASRLLVITLLYLFALSIFPIRADGKDDCIALEICGLSVHSNVANSHMTYIGAFLL